MSSNNEPFFKVFNNKYLRNKIFQHVKEIYAKHYYRSFNYYQLQMLHLIKSRNESLLIEKLNLYYKHIININNINNNNNNVKGYQNYKYYLNLNIECIYEIALWKELNNETIRLLFNTIEKSQIDKLDMDKLFNISVTHENYILIKFLILERNEKPNLGKLFSNLNYNSTDQDGFMEFIKLLLDLDSKLPIESRYFNCGQGVNRVLLKVIGKPTNIIGGLLLDILEIDPDSQEEIEIHDVASHAISSNDWFILKLLLLKVQNQFNIKIQEDSQKVVTIFGIQVNLEMIKPLRLKYSDVYMCDSFNLFKSLLNLDHDHFNPTKEIVIEDDYELTSVIISNHQIAEYLITNYKNAILSNGSCKWRFQFNCIDGTDSCETIIKNQNLFSNFQSKWCTYAINDLNIVQFQFLIDHYPSLVCEEMAEQFINNSNHESLLLYFSKCNTKLDITQIRIYKNAISIGNQSILEIIIPKLVNGYYNDSTTTNYNFRSCLDLLLHSVYYDNQYSFQTLLQYVNDPKVIKLLNITPLEIYELHKESIIEKLLYINQLEKRSEFLKMLYQIEIFEQHLFNYDQNIKIIDNLFPPSTPISNHLIFSEITNSNTFQNLIQNAIQTNNYKLFKQISKLPVSKTLNKQPYIKYILLSTNFNSKTSFNNNKLFLYLISIDFITLSNISTIIRYLVKSNNIIILKLFLCRNTISNNQYANYKFIIPFKIHTTEFTISDFNQYINLIHYYILYFSIKLKNTIILDYFNCQNYIFSFGNNDTEKQFNVKQCRNLKLDNDSQTLFVKNVNLIFNKNKTTK